MYVDLSWRRQQRHTLRRSTVRPDFNTDYVRTKQLYNLHSKLIQKRLLPQHHLRLYQTLTALLLLLLLHTTSSPLLLLLLFLLLPPLILQTLPFLLLAARPTVFHHHSFSHILQMWANGTCTCRWILFLPDKSSKRHTCHVVAPFISSYSSVLLDITLISHVLVSICSQASVFPRSALLWLHHPF